MLTWCYVCLMPHSNPCLFLSGQWSYIVVHVMLYPSMPLFAHMACCSLFISCSQVTINLPVSLLSAWSIWWSLLLLIHASYGVAPMELFDVCYVYYMSMIFIYLVELICLLFCASEGSIVMMFLSSQIGCLDKFIATCHACLNVFQQAFGCVLSSCLLSIMSTSNPCLLLSCLGAVA